MMHIAKARRHDDSGGQMIAALRQYREFRKLRQSDIHPEGRAFAFPAMHPARDVIVDRPARDKPVEQQLGIDARHDGPGAPGLATRYDPRGSAAGVFRTMSTHASRHARAIACVIDPIPPIAWPQAPGTPAASPKRW